MARELRILSFGVVTRVLRLLRICVGVLRERIHVGEHADGLTVEDARRLAADLLAAADLIDD